MSPLYSGCGRTLGLLCAWNSVAAFVSLFLFHAFANFPMCYSLWGTPLWGTPPCGMALWGVRDLSWTCGEPHKE